MSTLYVGYLALALGGALLLSVLFRVSFSINQTRAIIFSLVLTAITFTLWDILAVMLGHWSFGLSHTIGWMVSNQPIEEIGFFLIIPFFGIVLYEIACAKWRKRP